MSRLQSSQIPRASRESAIRDRYSEDDGQGEMERRALNTRGKNSLTDQPQPSARALAVRRRVCAVCRVLAAKKVNPLFFSRRALLLFVGEDFFRDFALDLTWLVLSIWSHLCLSLSIRFGGTSLGK